MTRWDGPEWFVVADSSFHIQNSDKLQDADLHQVLGLPSGEHLRLLSPITVVDELDGLKEAGKHRPRWRAGHTLGLLDGTLNGSLSGILLRSSRIQDEVRGQVSLEIVLDPPGHVRLPLPDDENVDRAVAIQSLAGCPVRLSHPVDALADERAPVTAGTNTAPVGASPERALLLIRQAAQSSPSSASTVSLSAVSVTGRLGRPAAGSPGRW
ncbi:hypothetical protein [Streptomyces olivochromogenes]|uniref:hypothetical protein n=1 Tax=Streptomyces olivochromogenes TaxID=1963 RepID=UPI0036B41ED3